MNSSKLIDYAILTGISGLDHTYMKSNDPAFFWACWGGRSADWKDLAVHVATPQSHSLSIWLDLT